MTAKELGEQSVIPASEVTSTSKIGSDGIITQQTTEVISTLTKREYFAGLVMQGTLANPSPEIVWLNEKQAAEIAVTYADALLEELAKEE